MARLYVIQRGQTVWDDQDRTESLAGSPLSEQGLQQMQRLAGELTGRPLAAIYTGPCQPQQQSAQLLGEALGLKVRYDSGLAGMDFGSWQGLTQRQIKQHHGRLLRDWRTVPSQVRPPGGETLEEYQLRLMGAIGGVCRRHRRQGAMLVLGPVAAALVRAGLEGLELDRLWELVQPPGSWSSYDTQG